ncbi:MAG: hypothetical protein ABI575_05090 [Oxalobacteraceae bacterium]
MRTIAFEALSPIFEIPETINIAASIFKVCLFICGKSIENAYTLSLMMVQD